MESVQCTRCRCVRATTDFKVSKAGKRNKTCMRCSAGAIKVADSPAIKVADSPTIKVADSPAIKVADQSADSPAIKVADSPAIKVADQSAAAEFADEIDRKIAAVVDPEVAWPIEPHMIEPHMQIMPESKDRMRAHLAFAVDPNNIADTARRLVRCDLALSSAECQLADMKQQLADMKISHLQSALGESRHLKDHIESNFESGMTWDNRGSWVIDFHTPIEEVSPNDVDATMWDIIRRLRPCNLKPVWNTNHCTQCNQRINK